MIVSAMVAIFTVGLGTRKEGEASAYSIFNGFNELPGAFNAAQLDFNRSIVQVRRAQDMWESAGEALVTRSVADYLAGAATIEQVAERCNTHAVAAVAAWWELSDQLMASVSYPSLDYPSWWLEAPSVNYTAGPPPSPDVPHPSPRCC